MKKQIQKIMLVFVLSVTMITGVNISPSIGNSQTRSRSRNNSKIYRKDLCSTEQKQT